MNAQLPAGFDHLFTVGSSLFAAVLLRDSQDNETWKKRNETFYKHGLLSFLKESIFKPKVIELDESKLDDVRYRRKLIRQLKAPRPGKWQEVRLTIDPGRLKESAYLEQMAAILAYKWALKLLPAEEPQSLLALAHLDEESLTYCLDNMGKHQSTAETVAARVLRTIAERLVDANPRFQAAVASIRHTAAEARDEFLRSFGEFSSQLIAEHKVASEAITAESNARFDALSAEIAADFARQAAQTQAVLDANAPSGLSPQEEFRRDVLRREKEFRDANRMSPRGKFFAWTLTIAAAVALAFFLEVDGTTLVEALK
jgi:hypothetical protein